MFRIPYESIRVPRRIKSGSQLAGFPCPGGRPGILGDTFKVTLEKTSGKFVGMGLYRRLLR
jgi:hypothetical protein